MAISEQVELLGSGLYKGKNIPDKLTLEAIPTISELEYISSEDFDSTMLDKILPQAVKEHINFRDLLEIDYHWILRCLRILNYGPYHTTGSIFCPNCGRLYGDYKVNLNTIGCKPLPKDFKNEIVVSRDEFIDFKGGDVKIKLLTIHEATLASKDTAFQLPDGSINRSYARMCYMIKSIGTDEGLSPIDVKMKIEKSFSSADYLILKDVIHDLTDYGVRAGGSTICPKCGSEATFIALIDDRYFRPTLDDLRTWKNDRDKREVKNSAGNSSTNV